MSRKTVLLVGATQGLGLALAAHYLGEGWRVIATTLKPSPGLEDLVREHAGEITVHSLDINDAAAVDALRAKLDGTRLDLLHNVAGILPTEKPVWAYSSDEVMLVLNTNAFSGVRLATLFAPLVAPGGVFAFTSSGMGSLSRNNRGGVDLYRVSKVALNMLVRGFAAQHGADRAVLLLCPGWAKTEMGGADATVDVSDSVSGLYGLILGATPQAEGAVFYDYTGARVPW